jgi:hypothetical protein
MTFLPGFEIMTIPLNNEDTSSRDTDSSSRPRMKLVTLEFNSEQTEKTGLVIPLFPDSSTEDCPRLEFSESSVASLFTEDAERHLEDLPIVRLLPDNPSEQAVLKLRIQLLEAKLARHNTQLDFAERIDVDHLEWRRQKLRIQQLQVGNFLLAVLSIVLVICAGCLAVIR